MWVETVEAVIRFATERPEAAQVVQVGCDTFEALLERDLLRSQFGLFHVRDSHTVVEVET